MIHIHILLQILPRYRPLQHTEPPVPHSRSLLLPILCTAVPTPFFKPTLGRSERPPGSPPSFPKGFLLPTRPLSGSLRCDDGPLSAGSSVRVSSSRRPAALATIPPPAPRRPHRLTAGPPAPTPAGASPCPRGSPDTRVVSVHLGLHSSPQPPNRHWGSPLTRPGK